MIESLNKKAMNTISLYGMEANKYIVGFSGGSDSMTLLHFLVENYSKENVVAIHVNHMIRGEEAERDESFCKDFCDKNGITYESVHVDVPSVSGGVALEETARNLRYKALEEKAVKYGAQAIALAHNANDNAETLLFNLVRGCGLSGMGIPPVRFSNGIKIVRPLITCNKDEILEYIKENDLSYVTDSTNDDTDYTRNYIRKNILPLLCEVKDGAIKNITEFSNRTRFDEEFIDEYAKQFIIDNDSLDIKKLKGLHKSVLTRVIMKKYSEVSTESMSSQNIIDVIGLIETGLTGNYICLPDNVVAIIYDGNLNFISSSYHEFITNKEDFSYSMSENGIVDDRHGFCVLLNKPEVKSNERLYSAYLPKDFTVRNKKVGDSIDYTTLTKRIKKLTNEVAFDARQRRPVFEYQNQVIWYPGFAPSDFIKNTNDKIQVFYLEKIEV